MLFKSTRPGPPAIFSDDYRYRYTLWRTRGDVIGFGLPKRYVNFMLLNPSTATDTQDDPTIRRCIGFAVAWGYEALCITNIFAFRATNPKEMKRQDDPVGPQNNFYLLGVASSADLIVCGWGNHGKHRDRSTDIRRMLSDDSLRRKVSYLGMGSEPYHPLYLPGNLKPTVWTTL